MYLVGDNKFHQVANSKNIVLDSSIKENKQCNWPILNQCLRQNINQHLYVHLNSKIIFLG